jgi:lysophospholipase L1-like esterase
VSALEREARPGGCARRLVTVLLALALVGLVLEIGFRLLGVRGWHEPRVIDWEAIQLPPERSLPGVSIQLEPHGVFTTTYGSDPRGYFDSGHELTYRLNSRGMRGPDYPRDKPAGTVRVMALGDSFTLGEGVRLADTWVAGLERRLAAHYGARARIEVMNVAVPGWSTTDEIAYLEQEGLAYEPDLVLVAYVLNDAEYAGGLDLYEDFREQYEKRWLRHSYLVSSLWAAVGRMVMADRYIDQVLGYARAESARWQRSLERLVRGHDLASAAGARYAVTIFPFMYRLDDGYPFTELHELVTARCSQEGIPVLDLFAAFRGRPYRALWVHPADQHPNEIGHAIAADALAEWIIGAGMLDGAVAAAAAPVAPAEAR